MNEFTPKEVAAMYWNCLEQQRNCVGSWDVFRKIPYVLQQVAPLRRVITYRSPEPGTRLKCTMRVFDAERAVRLCTALGYNPVQSLSLGYKVAQNEFYEAIQQYLEYHTACTYYA